MNNNYNKLKSIWCSGKLRQPEFTLRLPFEPINQMSPLTGKNNPLSLVAVGLRYPLSLIVIQESFLVNNGIHTYMLERMLENILLV